MTIFRALYASPSFKVAFDDLLELDDQDRDLVIDAVRRFPNDDNDLDDAALRLAVAALRTLREIVSDDSVDELLADIDEVGPPDGVEKLGNFKQHLSRTEAEEEDTFVRRVEQSTLPVLTKSYFSVDFRATRWRGTDEIKVVPVVVARLEFDEAVGGGTEKATFQISVGALQRLKDDIDSAVKFVKESAALIDEALLPKHFRELFMKDSDGQKLEDPEEGAR